MKKITFMAALLAVFTMNAQDTCETAVSILDGSTTTVAAIDGTDVAPVCTANGAAASPLSEWYSYTATADGSVTISSDLDENSGGDTRLHIYVGDCDSLTCTAGNDDVSGSNFLSSAVFPVVAGETYLIAWDNRWSADGFDFTLVASTDEVCDDVTYPLSEDFQGDEGFACYTYADSNSDGVIFSLNGANDLDGDGEDDLVVNIFPATGSGGAKDDWLISPALPMTTANEYTVSIDYNAFGNGGDVANESFELVMLDGPTPSDNPVVIGTFSDITQQGELNELIPMAYTGTATFTPDADGDYHLGIHATTASGSIFFVFNYEVTEEVLSLDDIFSNNFSYSILDNNLKLESNVSMQRATIFSITGQNAMERELSNTKENIDLSSLSSGMYVVQVQIENQAQTFKIVKK